MLDRAESNKPDYSIPKRKRPRIEGDNVIRKNGKVYMDRICPDCEKKHHHGEQMCIKCRNDQQAQIRKPYIKRAETDWEIKRQRRLAEHTRRIEAEMKAIRAAGLSPENDSVQKILDAGVQLDETINYSAFKEMAG